MGVQLQIPDEPEGPEIWEAHLPAWRAWCSISGQWRTLAVSTMAGASVVWLGLDYAAAQAGFALADIKLAPEVWDEVRTIEAGAVEESNRRGR